MQEQENIYLSQLHKQNTILAGLRQAILTLSLVVILAVFWGLKLTGITLAGEAFCGKPEHVHSDACGPICHLTAHVHDKTCYSDIRVDVEMPADWRLTMLGAVRNGVTAETVVSIAQSQLGYEESVRNFYVDTAGERRGITRYGQWYGNPYGNWSAMFVSFCLHYAGVENVPANAGPQSMQLEWEAAGLYRTADYYTPHKGDVLFLAKNGGAVDAVAIITGFENGIITVVEGDLDRQVRETGYSVHDPVVRGYGLVPDRSEPIVLPAAAGDMGFATTIGYNQNLFNDQNCFVLYTTVNGQHYAFDGGGAAVPITIDSSGNIFADIPDTNLLLWTFTGSNNNYTIQNLTTGRYMHAFTSNGGGVTTTGAYSSTIVATGSGVRVRSNSEYARLDTASGKFVVTSNASQGAIFKFGITNRCTVWLDGTAGGQGQLGGSENRGYAAIVGAKFQLPSTWKSPVKYEQTLRGWYDVTNRKYYAPGQEITVTGDMVLYADFVAATYDIGQYNAYVSDTVSTNAFITTHIFDYNYLFNVMSANPNITVNASSHTETWTMVQNGTVTYNGQETLDFVFVDYDGSSRLPDMSNRDDANRYLGEGIVTPGIYSPELGQILFDTDNAMDPATGQGIIGKTYLGTGDHLFHLMLDPNDPHYGYYYYDSARNAAAYNQSDGRFYVYDYLTATTDSVNAGIMSDFLPFNSPYANTAGKTIPTYNYNGENGEYAGVPHYRYDAKYSEGTSHVATNYAFGMKMDVSFYLPGVPGQLDAQGNTPNRDLFGNEMHFQFNGDDDVWVLVDGQLVLDIGGIHGIEGGDVNFSTGVVTVNGVVDEALSDVVKGIAAGEHTLTIMYLERGSSQSNAAFYFNLAPRYSLDIQKEDVLTQKLLDGAQFSVYTDAVCTIPAKLYTSEEAYHKGETARNTFTIENGKIHMWGLASGNTYYIKETRAPDADGYSCAKGIIRLILDKDGLATYYVDVLPDTDGSPPSNGFTVHNVRIDEQSQSVYIVVTNAPDTVTETTTVQVYKKWEDDLDHSGDYITAYLTVTDPDGTVRRIREVTLSAENNWIYTWTNLPKYDYERMTKVQYGIAESYESGYYSTVRKVTEILLESTTWAEAVEFKNGQTYVLQTSNGCLSTTGAGSDTGYKWVDVETAKTSPYALWTAHISGKTMKLTNGAGQSITFYYNNGNPTDFFSSTAGESNTSKQYLTWKKASGGFRFFYDAPNGQDYYMATSLNGSGKFNYSTSESGGMIFKPLTKVTSQEIVDVQDWAYQILNTPLAKENETSLTVVKYWDLGLTGHLSDYEKAQVTVKLLANGVDTGRTVTLSLKNSWRDSFLGLPYKDAEGNVIVYTVEESWQTDYWMPDYGPVSTVNGNPPTYSTYITNTHISAGGPELPTTGSAARMILALCGAGILLGTLVSGFALRRKRERRMK